MKLNIDILQLKNFGVFDIILLALFLVYIVFPVSTPEPLAPFIDSPFGMLTIFAIGLSLFVYRNTILGVLFIF